MAIKCITKDKNNGLTFGDVGVYQFFVDEDNDLMFKVDATRALYLERGDTSCHDIDEPILRIIKDLEIKEL